MTRLVHVIQNDPEVPPGSILDHISLPYEIHHPYRGEQLPDVAQISSLIVMGGAMGANDDHRHPFLTELKQLIRTVVAARIPYLGICLGGQLLAAALGATVAANRWEERGTLPVSLTQHGMTDALFNGIAQKFSTFQWHHDSFDLPEGAVLLAASEACPHQAFRIGESSWGLQFHPEVTEKIIRDWCAWDNSSEETVQQMIAVFSQHKVSYAPVLQHLMHNFLR